VYEKSLFGNLATPAEWLKIPFHGNFEVGIESRQARFPGVYLRVESEL